MTHNYKENKDFGFYSRTNSNCTACKEKCTVDANCGAIRCGGSEDPDPSNSDSSPGCLWWKKGVCLDDYWIYSKLDFRYGYTCYKG